MSSDEAGAWTADSTGILPGGDVGGDAQAGESYSVRYRRADRPGAMITRTVYPSKVEGQWDVYFVQVETEWSLVADPDDPGGSESWADQITEDESGMYTTAAEAAEVAYQVATRLLSDASSQDWDGATTA